MICVLRNTQQEEKTSKTREEISEDNEVPVDSLLLFSSKLLVDPLQSCQETGREKEKKKRGRKKRSDVEKIKKKR